MPWGSPDTRKRCCMKNCDNDMCSCLAKVKPKSGDERDGQFIVMVYFKCDQVPGPRQPDVRTKDR
jgi:hypothetical protein